MPENRKILATAAGIICGVVLVHPYVMIIHRFTDARHTVENIVTVSSSTTLLAFLSPQMLPMTIAFAFFGGTCGLLLGLLWERNERIIRSRYQIQLHSDLTAALHQLLGVVSHYILNGSLIISAHARRLEKKTAKEDLPHLTSIINQAEKNESVLKLIQETQFLQNIDPSNDTYQKLIELNQRIEKQLLR